MRTDEHVRMERFIFPSMYSVYANDPNGTPVTETSPLEAHSLYSETKIMAEDWLCGRRELIINQQSLAHDKALSFGGDTSDLTVLVDKVQQALTF